MTPKRKIGIAMSFYIALGIAMIHGNLQGIAAAVASGLLSGLVVMPQGRSHMKTEIYDSWGWSVASTRGTLMVPVIVGIGGLPFWLGQILSYFWKIKRPEMAFWSLASLLFLGGMMGVVVYFREYLNPITYKNVKSLDLEHREWFGIFQAAGILSGIIFIGFGASYLLGLMKKRIALPTFEISLLLYLAAGYVVWMLRPLHGRGKEIRDRINKLSTK